MLSNAPRIPAEYIVPLNINGLRGRMLRMPPKKDKKREILLVYGHHSSLERMYSFVEVLNNYGGITMPDLPGFGGMDSFYKINEKPSLDTMADYLATIVRLRYKNRRFTVAAFSYGFLVVTRMLQRYPEIAKRVDVVVSVVGFTHHEDFIFSSARKRMYRLFTKAFSGAVGATFFRNVFLHPQVLKTFYARTHNAKNKFAGLNAEEHKNLTDFEIYLWRINDVRTQMVTGREFLYVDNCRQPVDLPVWHVSVPSDKYFNNHVIEQHLNVIFKEVIICPAKLDKHMPLPTANKKEAASLIPRQIKHMLKENP